MQVFTGAKSKYIYTYRMKAKSEFDASLESFITDVGIMKKLVPDGATELLDEGVKKIMRKYKIKQGKTEAYHQHQNRAEQRIRDLKELAFKIMSASGAPDKYWDYGIEYARDIRNRTALESLAWRTPYEKVFGDTPDISPFKQHRFWDPVRYTTPGIKYPDNSDQAGRFLGIAWNTGDMLTYEILVDEERNIKRHIVVERSAVAPDRGDNKKLSKKRIKFDPIPAEKRTPIWEVKEIKAVENLTTVGIDLDDIKDDKVYECPTEDIVTEFESQEHSDERTPIEELYEIRNIVGHRKNRKGVPALKILWSTNEETWEPFEVIRQDAPLLTAEYVINNNLMVPYKPQWAKNLLHEYSLTQRRKTVRRITAGPLMMNGVPLPRNEKEALEFDAANGNHLWRDGMDAEVKAMFDNDVFIVWDGEKPPPKDEGWQYAPLTMILEVKRTGRRKGRLVLGGHVTDARGIDTYAATVRTENIRLMFYVVVINEQDIKTGDISTAYLNAKTKEKIWVIAGPAFGALQGKIMLVDKALYGAKGSGNAWYLKYSDYNRTDAKFEVSRIDASFWWRLDEATDLYDYLAHHVDDFITGGPNAIQVVEDMKAKFTITGDEGIPTEYLGIDANVNSEGTGWVMSARSYIKKAIPDIERLLGQRLGKASTPTIQDWRPSEDDSPLLDEEKRNLYQVILGKAIWLDTIGRIDITYSVNTLARYTHVAREQHFKDLVRIFEYLHKFPNEGIRIEPGEIEWDHPDNFEEDWELKRQNLKEYYPDVIDEWDPKWPEPKGKAVKVTIFVDADHGSNRADRRSITGYVIFIGSMIYKWKSKRQTSVEAATFGAEFCATRVAVEEAIAIKHMLHSIGVPIDGPILILGDNKSVIDNTTIAGSALKKKHLSIAYHLTREALAAGIIIIQHIRSEDNVADILTKVLPGPLFHKHVKTLMIRHKPE